MAGPVSLAYVTILFDGTSANYQPAGSVDQEYNVENSRDTTPPFIRFPGANFPVYSMLPQPDGSSYIVGEFTSVNATKRGRIARILGDGMLDPTFLSEPGANDFVRTLDLYRNGPHAGKIIVVGGFTSINGVARGGVYLQKIPSGWMVLGQ